MSQIRYPAELLLGRDLVDGWKVTHEVPHPQASGRTGGNFSCCYLVEREGQVAFLKAFDLSRALNSNDIPRAVSELAQDYVFEQEIHRKCRNRRMSRVVNCLSEGEITVDSSIIGRVPYLIFELAKSGDVRKHIDTAQRIDLAWKLRLIHHIAVGGWQLHSADIDHQDVKPSNVMIFDDHSSKLGDLGCARDPQLRPARGFRTPPGDPAYAPPELLYRYLGDPIQEYPRSCDLYLIGSMVSFVFVGFGTTALLLGQLANSHRPGQWTQDFRAVLPALSRSFSQVLARAEPQIDSRVRAPILEVISQLGNPDPARRGHPRDFANRNGQPTLQRYVSLFNQLALRAELGALPIN